MTLIFICLWHVYIYIVWGQSACGNNQYMFVAPFKFWVWIPGKETFWLKGLFIILSSIFSWTCPSLKVSVVCRSKIWGQKIATCLYRGVAYKGPQGLWLVTPTTPWTALHHDRSLWAKILEFNLAETSGQKEKKNCFKSVWTKGLSRRAQDSVCFFNLTTNKKTCHRKSISSSSSPHVVDINIIWSLNILSAEWTTQSWT